MVSLDGLCATKYSKCEKPRHFNLGLDCASQADTASRCQWNFDLTRPTIFSIQTQAVASTFNTYKSSTDQAVNIWFKYVANFG